jgi:S-DNA-T family DNA segregation ATPase FtsK/SpoIIIE
MQATQRLFAGTGVRKLPISRETPFNLVIHDELGALLAYGDRTVARDLRKKLAGPGDRALHDRAGLYV